MAFIENGWRVTVLDNLSRTGSTILCDRVQRAGARFIHGDIRNPADLEQAGSSYDLMLECSAEPSVLIGAQGAQAHFMVQNNLVGALHCFEWARARNVPIIFLSTSRVYPYDAINALPFVEGPTRFDVAGQGTGFGPSGLSPAFPMDGARSLYGSTKWAAEIVLQEYAIQYNLPAVINRCGVIAGPWQLGKVDQGVFTHWLLCHLAEKPLSYIGFGGQGKQVRDLLHVEDLTALLLIQAERIQEFRGDVFQAGGSAFSNLSLMEATQLCREITGRDLVMGLDPHDRPADVKWLLMDNSRTIDVFGWQPRRDARTILQHTYDWLCRHPDLFHALTGKHPV